MTWTARFAFLVSFVAARGLQFLAPIVTANFVSASDYGVIEFAYAIASVAVAIGALGTFSVIPFVMLGSLGKATFRGAVYHAVGVVLVGVLLIVCFVLVGGPESQWTIASLLAALLVATSLWSVVWRARGITSASLFIEALPYSVVMVAGVAASALIGGNTLRLVAALLAVVLAVMVLATAKAWRALFSETPGDIRYVETLRASVPLMLGGFLGLLALTSGRLGIGLLTDAATTGTFSALTRVAALPVVAHQIAVVARFQNIYKWDVRQLQTLALQIGAMVIGAVAVTLVALPVASPWLGLAFHRAATNHPLAAHLSVAQVILWSSIALNDTIAARHECLGRALPWTALAFGVAVALAGWNMSSGLITVDRFAVWHTVVMFSLFAGQSLTLARFGVRFERYWGASLLAFLAAVGWSVLVS